MRFAFACSAIILLASTIPVSATSSTDTDLDRMVVKRQDNSKVVRAFHLMGVSLVRLISTL